jgi:hypothetical protein
MTGGDTQAWTMQRGHRLHGMSHLNVVWFILGQSEITDPDVCVGATLQLIRRIYFFG